MAIRRSLSAPAGGFERGCKPGQAHRRSRICSNIAGYDRRMAPEYRRGSHHRVDRASNIRKQDRATVAWKREVSAGWKFSGDAQKWLPVLAAAEMRHGIPTDLLARIAFQESSFRPGVISGAIKSKPGAVGIMQLLPKYNPGAGVDPVADIDRAGTVLDALYRRFRDWQEAVAAYNWGEGNEHHAYVEHGSYRLVDMPTETQNYVREVFADVPLQGALLA